MADGCDIHRCDSEEPIILGHPKPYQTLNTNRKIPKPPNPKLGSTTLWFLTARSTRKPGRSQPGHVEIYVLMMYTLLFTGFQVRNMGVRVWEYNPSIFL